MRLWGVGKAAGGGRWDANGAQRSAEPWEEAGGMLRNQAAGLGGPKRST
jgi:hypothetical protein